MKNFVSNPIVIRDRGSFVSMVEMLLDPAEKEFYIEIRDMSNQLIEKKEVGLNTLISIDKSYEKVSLIYKNADGSIITTQVIDCNKVVNTTSTTEIKKVSDFDLIEEVKLLVKGKMDYPIGTKTEVANHTEMLKKCTLDKNARAYVMAKIRHVIVASNKVKNIDIECYVYHIYSELYGMGVLQELDDDLSIGEIMVNASEFPNFKCHIYYVREGVKYKYDRTFADIDEVKTIFTRAIEFSKKELNSVEGAIVEATRANKDRVNVIIPGASDNYVLNIRKFSNFIPNIDMMRKSGTVDRYIDRLMDVLVRGKANIGIGGPMGAGKTTFVNFLLTYTDPMERKVVIASISETDVDRVLKGHDVVILNVDDEKGFSFERLTRASLRTTASRIIVPESRGGEFKQVYEANLKTKGNMFTAHALDDASFLDMCVDMYLSSGDTTNESSQYIKDKLSKSIDIVIIMRKVGEKIRIKSISEVVTENGKFNYLNLLYEWEFDPENPLVGEYKVKGKLTDAIKIRLNENGVKMSEMTDL